MVNELEPDRDPEEAYSPPDSPRGDSRRAFGTGLAWIGGLVLVYGASACFVLPALPPNGQTRLPSIYLMAVGGVLTISGLAVRELRRRTQTATPPAAGGHPEISTASGLLILALIIVALLIAISLL